MRRSPGSPQPPTPPDRRGETGEAPLPPIDGGAHALARDGGPLNADALRPLFASFQEPNKHRMPPAKDGLPAIIAPGRRPSRSHLVPLLRHAVGEWRRNQYVGASETSRTLLLYWFETAHENDFRYHFCQREAIETIIYLYEVVQYRSLSALYASLFADNEDVDLDRFLLSVTVEEDARARYACKIATGGGKTKVMSLAIVWSYFHSVRELGSEMARHFVVIAPNLIVFERLKDDFAGAKIFYEDPLLPPEWREQFQLQVLLQEEAGGDAATGALYLTNIHRLYERERGANSAASATPPWSGPIVNTQKALKTGQLLRDRITSHPRILILNDEAHHLHDPDSAWNEAIAALDRDSQSKGNGGVIAQLDFSATPKHNDGSLFRHIVCDFPLGEAVDAGIVKVPIIGHSDQLIRQAGTSAAQIYRPHLRIGYKQYEYAYTEWQETRKPILFVMTESTDAANEITAALDSDDYPLLKGRVVNLHTKLKGKIKSVKQGSHNVPVFVEDEKNMSDDDLKIVRQISRDLDKPNSPYRCVVSVLMLREGWDVKNVTTIVPLRAYSAESNILAEQTLGRGLRRMTPPGLEAAVERVTVIEHEAFVRFYREELGREGLFPEESPLTGPNPTSVSIFPDAKKDIAALDIEIPRISDAIATTPTLEGLTFEEIRDYFKKRYDPLPIGSQGKGELVFEERALFTQELIASWKIDRGLLSLGYTAVTAFVQELEKACQLRGMNSVLAPLVQKFLQEVLFERPVNLFSGEVDHRMGQPDVVEHIRATFAPLIRQRTTTKTERKRTEGGVSLSSWKAYQATESPTRPCVPAQKTLFNLIPCDSDLETQFADFCDTASDAAAFAKNAGPQKLLIDYLAPNGRPALYAPDFLVRLADGNRLLVETKGLTDIAAPYKAQAAIEWCKSATTKGVRWQYVFLTYELFAQNNDFSLVALASACAPRLKGLLSGLTTGQQELPFEATPEEVKRERTEEALHDAGVSSLPDELAVYVTQAVNQLAYDRKKNYPQFGGAFQPLLFPLEFLCGQILRKYLAPCIPSDLSAHTDYFDPYLDNHLTPNKQNVLIKYQQYLKKSLVYNANCNRIGTLIFCLEYADSWRDKSDGVWADVAEIFAAPELKLVAPQLNDMNNFRNRHVAHIDQPLTDGDAADAEMKRWIVSLAALYAVVNPAAS